MYLLTGLFSEKALEEFERVPSVQRGGGQPLGTAGPARREHMALENCWLCIYIYLYVYIHIYTSAHIYIYIYAHTYPYINMCIYTCIYMYIHTHIYIYISDL